MPSKPSKSELESALSGRQKPVRRSTHARDQSIDLHLDAQAPRRQQVIGGNLTGVSGKHSQGWRSKLQDINIINWVAAAIVLLILIAFFWPTENNESIREVAEKTRQVPAESFYTESRIDEPEQIINKDQPFSRETDIDRASQYREQENQKKQIRELVQKAAQQSSQGKYTIPEGDNALNTYREIQQIDPRNRMARDGINEIKSRFLTAGYSALEKGNRALATSSLAKLATIDKESEEYQELTSVLQQWITTKRINDILKQARQAEKDNKLILPAKENALHYYQQILELDVDNAVANRGVKNIADTYIKRANNAFINGEYEAATGYLATVSVIDPGNPSIKLIRNLITNAKPIASARPDNNTKSTQTTSSASNADVITSRNDDNKAISANKTPQRQASEQAAFDRQYLTRGLEAYYKGEYEIAKSLLQPLADKGVARAQFRVAYMYYLGRGFTKNRKEADRIIRASLPAIQKFANEGRSWAQSDLGSLYEDGLVLPRDYNEAVYWYRTSAEKGYPGAQTNLGIMYARGRGVAQSRRTAIEWFQRAAKQGDIAAKRNLESMGIDN